MNQRARKRLNRMLWQVGMLGSNAAREAAEEQQRIATNRQYRQNCQSRSPQEGAPVESNGSG